MNSLEVETISAKTVFLCEECNYKKEIPGVYREKIDLARKKDVLAKTEPKEYPERYTLCPKCPSTTANYYEMQIRSADEPMTIFNTCTQCKHTWRE